MPPENWRSLTIDEEGYLISEGLRLNDEDFGREVLNSLTRDDRGRFFAQVDGQPVAIFAFDEPLVVRSVTRTETGWTAHMPYGFDEYFGPEAVSLDPWDRFHAVSRRGIPMVLSRAAQMQFFNSLDDYDDESITAFGRRIVPPPWLEPNSSASEEKFWTNIYQTEQPGWELGREAMALAPMVQKIKIPRSRILVLGCGQGHDAAFLARQGHLVKAVDISPEGLERARAAYGNIPGLEFHLLDLFQLPQDWRGQFDLIFEHTCFCAVSPERRDELIKIWLSLLAPQGHLLGIFFVMDKRRGPPWGGSEWELRRRLSPYFDFRYWLRWPNSIEKRQNTELVIYAQKKS